MRIMVKKNCISCELSVYRYSLLSLVTKILREKETDFQESYEGTYLTVQTDVLRSGLRFMAQKISVKICQTETVEVAEKFCELA